MGSVIRTAGSLAAAMLMNAGLAAVPSAAYAQQVAFVPCTTQALISAITAANDAGAGTLRLSSSCDYALTAKAADGSRGPVGLPIINGNIRLIGGRSTTISRPSSAPLFRILQIAGGAVLTVRNIMISGGNAGAETGGGILNARGNVVLTRTTVAGNTADNGAGISNDSGRMILDRSLIINNATRAGGGGGGGIYNDGSLSLGYSRITGNNANTDGGGVYNGQGGWYDAYRTTIDANTAGQDGGGAYNATDSRLVLRRSLIERNTAARGGGIYNHGPASRMTLRRNVMRLNTPDNCAPNNYPGCTG